MSLELSTKFTLGTSAVVLVAMSFFAFMTIKNVRNMSTDNAIEHVEHLSETLLSTTHYEMLVDNRARVYQMMEEVGAQEGISRIRLFNKDGLISFSTAKEEVGSTLDVDSEGCNGCHIDNKPPHTDVPTEGRARFFSEGNNNFLGVTKGIYNKPSCYTAACHVHSASATVLGTLDVIIPLNRMEAQTAASRNQIVLLTVFVLLLVSLSLAFLTHKLVNVPVNRLLYHTRRLADGELDSRVSTVPSDEIGELALAFNDMAQNLQKAQRELKEWANTLEVKVEERTARIQSMQSKLVRSEKLATIGELVAGIAHEINNPLTGILMYASMLESDPRLDAGLKDDLSVVVRETQRCAEIVRGLLGFSRESIPQKRAESINSVMERTLALIERQADFQNIRISREYGEGLPQVLIDHNQLEQVFMNILINASQAMEGKGGGSLSITTGVESEGRGVFVRIADTGCGIPEKNLARIFDPFYTTKENRGTGLGLSVSYGIVENHGGQIEVSSQEGKGTTFTITLPFSNPAVAATED
ncbi:MAG: sensor histidine kinase [Desulfuromonadales bacterium]|uniref:sensor histidine kinase n=1 Tax=Desulfuromonas sp. KJ2020 TaxID=2919173 RepID=UPI0020A76110|nr:HAMP domain-containing sensor histidine kinase [Desulfuromonas sp. KJ2020]MCP3175782.1 ATP-binding protein [Desulfuromonas sp. KJ2020]